MAVGMLPHDRLNPVWPDKAQMSDLMVATDDGGWKAFKPLTDNSIMVPVAALTKTLHKIDINVAT